MFQPNVATWQQQQQQQHHPQQTQSQQPQLQHPQQLQTQYMPTQTEGKWNQPGLVAPLEQQATFQPFGYNPIANQSNYVNYEHQLQTQVPPQQQINNMSLQQDQQSLTQNFFDNNQNKNGKSEEWGDWGDWNENNLNMENNNQQKMQQQNMFPIQQEHTQNATNIINESFTASDNNWNWNMNINSEPAPTTTTAANLPSSTVLPSPPAMQAQQVQRHISNFQQPPAQILDRANESATQENSAENFNQLAKSALPATTATNNNIPNTVFVTQAKPVTMPSRQYASTPIELTTNAHVEQIIAPPPAGFQNELPSMATVPIVSSSIVAPPSKPMVAPPPTTTTPLAPAGNPFKRTGATQHHVANFIPTTQIAVPMKSNENNNNSFKLPPVAVAYEQPDNSEVLHENQEVVTQSYATMQPQQQHLNDERNQYLQTSHLSEIAIEENLEADSLPPPGLSRLVLGEPELEANQRLVTGTEDILPDLVGNMRLDERQADGEDNTNATPVLAATVPAVDNMQIVADRNLYLVPGQSNGNNDQLPRVLTGFDNAETHMQTHAISIMQQQQQQQQQQQNHAPQHQQHINISEQREIDLDGENIEDQQQQQQSVPQQRNEPPVEGAAAQVPQQQQQMAVNTSLDIKESSQANAGKEENDLPQQRKHLGNSRKQPTKEHEKKHSSVDRFNSDVETDEAEYSSDKERARERKRHRRAYREGSVRSETERERYRDRDWEREEHELYKKERRQRERRERDSGEKEKTREKYRGNESGAVRRSGRYTRYEHDSSVDEGSRKEKSLREKSLRSHRERDIDQRSDREYDEYNRTYRQSKRTERNEEARTKRERDYDEADRRRTHEKRGSRRSKPERGEYEDYLNVSSRNTRESAAQKERGQRAYDPRQAAMYGYPHGGQVNGSYDPYYYYNYMARYNHPAYNDMIQKYYGDISAVGDASSTTPTGPQSEHLAADSRQSVHSGRSSLQQEHVR